MRVDKIRRIRDCRIFRDFQWPTGLHDFGRYNLIYGWNASGKTTLSHVFRSLQHRVPLAQGDAEVVINGQVVRSGDFGTAALPQVRVFNRDFIDRNVFESPGQSLPPVYYLGEDSTSIQQRINALKAQEQEALLRLTEVEVKHTQTRSAFDAFCTDRARTIKLQHSADRRFLNYDAPRYRDFASELSSMSPTPSPLTYPQRQQLVATATGIPMPKLAPQEIAIANVNELTDRVQALLSQDLVVSRIEELVASPEVANWVQQGLSLHAVGIASQKCRFCAQELPTDRIRKLEEHFNDTFKRLQTEIASLLAEIERAEQVGSPKSLPAEGAFYPHIREQYIVARDAFTSQSAILLLFLSTLRRALISKRDHPFSRTSLAAFAWPTSDRAPTTLETILAAVVGGISVWGAILGASTLATISKLVDAHNLHTVTFTKSVEKAREGLVRDDVIQSLEQWNALRAAADQAESDLSGVRKRLIDVRAQISSLEPTVRQHQRPADELTREMAEYLGREELVFTVSGNGYIVMRSGEPAMHLSEGERTAVAFMYFLKSLADTGFDSHNGVVIIDDPVSSLDANSLYCAFGYMKDRTQGVGQLFILTHSFSFFSHVKNWLNYIGGMHNRPYDPSRSRDVHFYMITADRTQQGRSARIEELDPLLHAFDSEYHYLFARVRAGAAEQVGSGLDRVYGMPNIARRLLESFTAFRVPDKTGQLWRQLESLKCDPPAKRSRIIRFLHVHSHGEQLGGAEHDLSILSEAPAVLADVLDLIRQNDAAHFEAMQSITAPGVRNHT